MEQLRPPMLPSTSKISLRRLLSKKPARSNISENKKKGLSVTFKFPHDSTEQQPAEDCRVRIPEVSDELRNTTYENNEGRNGLEESVPYLAHFRAAIHIPRFQDFDQLINLVRLDFNYQLRILIFVIYPLAIFHPLLMMERMALLYTPDHWCAPGQHDLYIHDSGFMDWKRTTIPLINDTNGELRFSQCTMYSKNQTVVSCQYGWEYSSTYYNGTFPSDFDWVCDNAYLVMYADWAQIMGSIVGALLFGTLSDIFGRKFIFELTYCLSVVLHLLILQFWNSSIAALTYLLFSSLLFPVMLVTPIVILLEISSSQFRVKVLATSGLFTIFGVGVFILLTSCVNTWYYLTVAITAFTVVNVIYVMCVYESPRWLYTVGKFGSASKFLMKIATGNELNGLFTKSLLVDIFRLMKKENRKTFIQTKINVKFLALFTKLRSARTILILFFCWATNSMIYKIISSAIVPLTENYFWNIITVHVFDLPGPIVAYYLAKEMGRPGAQMILYSIIVLSSSLAGIAGDLQIAKTVFEVIVKFLITAVSIITTLQTAELLPTEVRMTGIGICIAIGLTSSNAMPLLDSLLQENFYYPYITVSIIALAACILCGYLPETLDDRLMDFMEELFHLKSDNSDNQWGGCKSFIKVIFPLETSHPREGTDNPNFNRASSSLEDESTV